MANLKDTIISGVLRVTGALYAASVTLTGKLTLGAAPTENMDAATKQYVDATADLLRNQLRSHSTSVVIYDSDWDATTLIAQVSVPDVYSGDNVIVSPSPNSIGDYINYGISCISQSDGYLEFICDSIPAGPIEVNLLIFYYFNL